MSYTTSLETLKHDVKSILNEKLKATSPEAVADYIGFALDNNQSNINRAKEAKKELDSYIKEQENIIETVKEQSAQWLAEEGITKLQGMRISSVTTYEPKPSEELVIHSDSWCLDNPELIKTTIDKTAVKNFLKDSEIDYSEYAEIKITHKQPLIKINKKKV